MNCKKENVYIEIDEILYNIVKYNTDTSKKEWHTIIAEESDRHWGK